MLDGHAPGTIRTEHGRITVRRASQAALEVAVLAGGEHGAYFFFLQRGGVTSGGAGTAIFDVPPVVAFGDPRDLIRFEAAHFATRQALQTAIEITVRYDGSLPKLLGRAGPHDE